MSSIENARVMGIVNITDDSYYAKSRHLDGTGNADLAKVRATVTRQLKEGAAIIDFGACSTRPGAKEIGAEEEWRRLEPVISMIAQDFRGITISVDTYWSDVVRKTYDKLRGTDISLIANDVSAGLMDAEMLPTVAGLGIQYIAMHNHGRSDNIYEYPNGVIEDIHAFFDDFALRADAVGLKDWILDPGFGFSKTVEENWAVLRRLDSFKRPYGGKVRTMLVGVSRKSMIYKRFGITPEDSLPATYEAHRVALTMGADILRVHDVAPVTLMIKEYKDRMATCPTSHL